MNEFARIPLQPAVSRIPHAAGCRGVFICVENFSLGTPGREFMQTAAWIPALMAAVVVCVQVDLTHAALPQWASEGRFERSSTNEAIYRFCWHLDQS